MKRYYSKIDWWLVAVLAAAILPSVYFEITSERWQSTAASAVVIAFITHLYATTYYEVGHGILRIRAGFIINHKIPLDSIISIKRSYNPIASPALSLHRLEVTTSSTRYFISPKRKERPAFLAQLQAHNPGINIKNEKGKPTK